jgi:GNAT superfamily N-acetyltransferase
MSGAVFKTVAVRTPAQRRAFVDLPFRLYRDDPLWVPPLRGDMHRLMSPSKNPFFDEAEIEHFLCVDAQGRTVGRISASIHHAYNERYGQDNAFFGLLEMENDPAIARALLEAVETWGRERQRTLISGPYSYTSTQDASLLVENVNGMPPTLLQTYNPLHYRTLLEACGYRVGYTLSTYGGRVDDHPETPRARLLLERVRARHRITARSATRAELKANMEEIRQLFNKSFTHHPEIVSISAPVFRFMLDSVRPFVDLAGVRVIEVERKPKAFFVILPDLNEVLAKLRGRLGLLDLLRLPWYRRGIRKAVVALIGSEPDAHGTGLGRLIADEMRRYVTGRFEELHTMWIDDRNPASYVLAQNAGMQPTKRYAVFRKALVPAGAACLAAS